MSSRFTKPIGLVALVITAGLGLSLATAELRSGGDAEHDAEITLSMDGDVEVMLLRIGMTPETMAAAGVDSTTLLAALSAEEADLADATSTLSDHDATCAEYRRQVDSLRRIVRSGNATEEQVAELASAKQSCESAFASRDAFLEGVCGGICEHVSADAMGAIQRICMTKSWKSIPVTYRTKERSEAEWLAIREALSAKKTHEMMGLEVPAEATTLLTSLASETEVSEATADCESCLPGVQGLWDTVFDH